MMQLKILNFKFLSVMMREKYKLVLRFSGMLYPLLPSQKSTEHCLLVCNQIKVVQITFIN